MTARHTADDAAREAATQQALEDTLLEASDLLGRIRRDWPLIVALGDSYQPGLGFVPADVRRRMGAAYRQEKRDRRAAEIKGLPTGTGQVPAPDNLTSWTLSAEAALMLRDWIRRIVADHRAAGGTVRGLTIVVGHLPAEPSDQQVIEHLRELMWTITTTTRARHLAADLRHYVDRIRDMLDGEQRRDIDGNCPWCGRRTLVLYLESGVIRCERPRDPAGVPLPCQCAAPVCGCRNDPWWTHTWLRESSSTVTSWTALAGRLQLQRRTGGLTSRGGR